MRSEGNLTSELRRASVFLTRQLGFLCNKNYCPKLSPCLSGLSGLVSCCVTPCPLFCPAMWSILSSCSPFPKLSQSPGYLLLILQNGSNDLSASQSPDFSRFLRFPLLTLIYAFVLITSFILFYNQVFCQSFSPLDTELLQGRQQSHLFFCLSPQFAVMNITDTPYIYGLYKFLQMTCFQPLTHAVHCICLSVHI